MNKNDKAKLEANLQAIPEELKTLDQWVVYKSRKTPLNARIGTPAKSNDPRTWSSFSKARDAVLSDKYRGVGFVFTANDPYACIDLDHVIDLETGEIQPWAQEIIDQMDSYTEVSMSGTGIHIIVEGKKPGGKCRKGNIEIYDQAQYIALTGNLWGGRHD